MTHQHILEKRNDFLTKTSPISLFNLLLIPFKITLKPLILVTLLPLLRPIQSCRLDYFVSPGGIAGIVTEFCGAFTCSLIRPATSTTASQLHALVYLYHVVKLCRFLGLSDFLEGRRGLWWGTATHRLVHDDRLVVVLALIYLDDEVGVPVGRRFRGRTLAIVIFWSLFFLELVLAENALWGWRGPLFASRLFLGLEGAETADLIQYFIQRIILIVQLHPLLPANFPKIVTLRRWYNLAWLH